mmetsp:Transcript_77320/g.151419  ORF Transcript_77320/g.151419 Transcript_77320/m.151419 type:complete len:224 (-) Transcript_77320:26-697(-)
MTQSMINTIQLGFIVTLFATSQCFQHPVSIQADSRVSRQEIAGDHKTEVPVRPSSQITENRIAAHGSHVMLDFTGFFVDATEGAALTMRLMRKCVAQSSAREVHHKSVVLGDDGVSPPGFTSVVLIDESHVTAHCYSEKGWLAIDVFTCGAHPRMPHTMADFLEAELLRNVPSLVLSNRFSTPRFLHTEEHNKAISEPEHRPLSENPSKSTPTRPPSLTSIRV